MALREELWPHLLQPRPDEARPDLASPLAGTWTKSAAGIWIPGAPNAITRKPWVSGGSGAEPTVAGTSAGLGIYTSGKWIQTDLPSASFSALTWTAVICPDAAPSSTGFSAFFQTGQTTFNWNHASASYQGAFSLYNSGGYPTCKFTGGFTAGKTEVIGGTYDGTTLVVYRAGVFENSQTAANGLSGVPLNSLQLLGGTGGTVAWAGSMPFFLWDTGRAYSAAEMAVLHANVWQVFAPRRIWVPVSAGGSDIDIAGVVGNATAAGITGAPAVSIDIAGAVGNAVAAGVAGSAQLATEIAGATGNAAAAGITGSTQVATEIAGSVGNAVAAGVAGSASVTNDISIDGVVGNAVAAGIAGDTSVGSDISISGTVGNAVAAGTAGVPGVSTTIAATVGNATAAGVPGLAAIGVLIDGAVGNATAAGITGTLSLEIIISGVVGNAVAAGVSGSVSVAVESETEPTPSVAEHSYAVGAMLDVVRERDPREVRRLMRKKHDEAEVLGMIQSLFDQGAFDNESTLQ